MSSVGVQYTAHAYRMKGVKSRMHLQQLDALTVSNAIPPASQLSLTEIRCKATTPTASKRYLPLLPPSQV